MIRNSSDHAVFSCIYNKYTLFLAVETYDISMATNNWILSEILMKELDTIFE